MIIWLFVFSAFFTVDHWCAHSSTIVKMFNTGFTVQDVSPGNDKIYKFKTCDYVGAFFFFYQI